MRARREREGERDSNGDRVIFFGVYAWLVKV